MHDIAESLPEPLAALTREHRVIAEVVEQARHIIGVAAKASAEELPAAETLETMRDLEAFLTVDLQLHIAKEEQVLFPALRGLTKDTDVAVEDMIAQHDEVRSRRSSLRESIARLDQGHAGAQAAASELSAAMRAAEAPVSRKPLSEVNDALARLDWILEGHFGDEEEGVFVPAAELLSPDQLAGLASRILELEIAFDASP